MPCFISILQFDNFSISSVYVNNRKHSQIGVLYKTVNGLNKFGILFDSVFLVGKYSIKITSFTVWNRSTDYFMYS